MFSYFKRLHIWVWMMLPFIVGTGCSFYKFSAANIPIDIKTIYIDQFIYQYESVDLELPPQLRQRFVDLTSNRTKLVVVDNKENADWIITGSIQNYSTQLVGVSSNTLSASNPTIQGTALKLNINIKVTLTDRKSGESKDYTVSDETSASGDRTLTDIQNTERPDIISRLSQSMFNQLYSNW